MADVKVENEANVVASIAGTEISYLVQDPTGTPTPGQVTKAVEKAYYNSAPTITGTATIDRILPTVSSAADPTTLDWAATKDVLTWTFTANRTITSSNVPTTVGVTKTIYASAASGGPWVLTFTGGTITPSGDAMSVSASGTVIITLETIGSGAFTVSQRIGWADIYGTTTGVQTVLAAPGAIGGTTPAAITGTTIQANTGFVPDANDGAYLGTASLGFSDLFLAEGGVINWDNGDVTITQTSNDITIAGITTFGVGTSTAVTLGTIELGHASDTTLSRAAAGEVAVEGTVLAKKLDVARFNNSGNAVDLTTNVLYGGASKTLTMPAVASTSILTVKNMSGNSWTIARAGSDVFDASATSETLTDGKTVSYCYNGAGVWTRIGALS